ncbi:hypothetical protein D3C71_1278650 [compost metagenome]
METAIFGFAIGRAGDFTVAFGGFDHQIVTPGRFRRHAEGVQRVEHNRGGDGFIVLRFPGHKGKAGITEVVEHRAATAAATGQTHVVLFHAPRVALFPRVLRAANDHRIGVTPEEQDALRGGHLAEDALFHREVEPGIVRVRDKQAERRHGRFPFPNRTPILPLFFLLALFLFRHRFAGRQQEWRLLPARAFALQQGTR